MGGRAGGLSDESTATLLERSRAGDPDAVECLLARHLAPLQRWARGRLPGWARSMADTDDLVQDTMLETFKRLGTFEPRQAGALQSYLRQAILNRIKDELRRRARRGSTVAVDDVTVPASGSAIAEAAGRETLDAYERALTALTANDREAIIGRVELGYSYDELAAVLGKPTPDAARKAAQRALVRLAEEMKRFLR